MTRMHLTAILIVCVCAVYGEDVETYEAYPDASQENPELSGEELRIAAQFLLIETIQKRHFGALIDDVILKPTDPQVIFNWVGGGLARYQREQTVITSTFALSLPTDQPYIDDQGTQWSGLGMEYFFEGDVGYEWQATVLLHLAKQVFTENGYILTEGMFIPHHAGFIPIEHNPEQLGLLAIRDFSVVTPDGKVDYIKLVPLNPQQLESYKALEGNRRLKATEWFKTQSLPSAFSTPLAKELRFNE